MHDGVTLRWTPEDLPDWEAAADLGPVVSLTEVTKTFGHGDEAVHALRGVSLSPRAARSWGWWAVRDRARPRC